MNYSMEQLVRALAGETVQEIFHEEAEEAYQNGQQTCEGPSKWKLLADAVIKEVDAVFDNKEVTPRGHLADEAVFFLKPIVRPHSHSIEIKKLFVSLEKILGEKSKDPRPYMLLLKQAAGNTNFVENFFRERAFK